MWTATFRHACSGATRTTTPRTRSTPGLWGIPWARASPTGLPAVNRDDSHAYGAFIVQTFDRIATEVYIGGRVYDLDRPGVPFDNIVAVLSGARIKF